MRSVKLVKETMGSDYDTAGKELSGDKESPVDKDLPGNKELPGDKELPGQSYQGTKL